MVPAAPRMRLKQIPLTVNGKLDRARLPAPTDEVRNWRAGYCSAAHHPGAAGLHGRGARHCSRCRWGSRTTSSMPGATGSWRCECSREQRQQGPGFSPVELFRAQTTQQPSQPIEKRESREGHEGHISRQPFELLGEADRSKRVSGCGTRMPTRCRCCSRG